MKLVSFLAFIAAAFVLAVLAAHFAPSLHKAVHAMRKADRIQAYNALTDGVSPGRKVNRLADAAQATRHLLFKVGSDANHVAVIAAAANQPLGWCYDSPEAAEDSVGIQLFGGPDTVLGVAGATIAAGAKLYSKGDGKVMGTPTSAGTYWLVGEAVTAGTDGVVIEINPLANPQKVVVLANGSTLSQTQAVMLDGAIPIVLAA